MAKSTAEAMASGAKSFKSAEVFEQTEDAVWDLNRLFATARQRFSKKVVTPKEAAKLFFDKVCRG